MVRGGEDLKTKVCGRVVSVVGAEGTAGPRHGDWIKVLASREDPSEGQGHRAARRVWGRARTEGVEGARAEAAGFRGR